MDATEIQEYTYRTRKEYEEKVRMQKHHIGAWIKYAEWEANLGEFARARSVFERGIDVDFQNNALWLKYAEMEMRNKNVNHARNVWERAVKHLPRVEQFWYKYIHMEELLGEIQKVRDLFERWLVWEPGRRAYQAYLEFEVRNGDTQDKCRDILNRMIDELRDAESFLQAAKYEEKH